MIIDHPLTDPGDGRTECDVCGKWVFLVTHSCKHVPVTEAAWNRHRARVTDAAQARLAAQKDTEVSEWCHCVEAGYPGPHRLSEGCEVTP